VDVKFRVLRTICQLSVKDRLLLVTGLHLHSFLGGERLGKKIGQTHCAPVDGGWCGMVVAHNQLASWS